MKVRFISLASGSSGNCYYLGTDTYGILIDAGIGIRTIKKTLRDINVAMESIRAVFVTHDHADHIKAVGHLGEKMNIPVYTTARIHTGINRSYCMTEKLHSSVRYLEKEQPMELEDFHIESFEVPHDGTDNVGYCIEIDGKVFSFLTDLGEITPTAAKYIRKANYLILEANYDDEMLKMGSINWRYRLIVCRCIPWLTVLPIRVCCLSIEKRYWLHELLVRIKGVIGWW